MSLSYTWVGATTPTAVVVKARLSGETARLHVSASADLSSPLTSAEVSPDNGVADLRVEELDADTRYYYGVEIDGDIGSKPAGEFRTHPPAGEPADFTVAASSCAGLEPEHPGVGDVAVPGRISNHPVFATIRDRDPLMFLHMGDLHYYNIGSGDFVPGHDADTYRAAYDDVFAQDHQAGLYSHVATQHVWDDHDYGPNDSDVNAPGREAACQVYRERVPHYELSDELGIWHSWNIGRVCFVGLDVRTYRSPNEDPDTADKTMLGSAQKEWLRGLLETSDAALLVVLSVNRWFDSSVVDSWSSYTEERAELIAMFDSLGWAGRVCVVAGDVHAVAMDSGGNSPGRLPVLHFASLDSAIPEPQDHYDLGPSIPGRGQYGLLRFADSGSEITVTATAYRGEEEIMSHSFTVAAEQPTTDEQQTTAEPDATADAPQQSPWDKVKRFFNGLFGN